MTTQDWRVWTGSEPKVLSGLPPGSTVEGSVVGFGAVHFHRHPEGQVLVYGPEGVGAAIGLGAASPALQAVVLAFINGLATDSIPNGTSDPAVVAIQTQWNADGSTPQLVVDGLYGGCAAAASQAVNPAAPAAYVPNLSDGTYNCATPGPYVPGVPGGGGGGPPYPDPGNCPSGTAWNSTTGQCVATGPNPTPTPGTPASGGSGYVVLGVLAAAAVGVVAIAALSSSPSTPAKAAAKKKRLPHKAAPAHHRARAA